MNIREMSDCEIELLQKVLDLRRQLAEAKEIVEHMECECQISLPVNDFPRDVICERCEYLDKWHKGEK